MSIYVRQVCPSCGREGRVREENLGLKVRCKQCGATITLARPEAESGPRRLASLGVAGEVVPPVEVVRSLRMAEQRERLLKASLAEMADDLARARRELADLADRAERLRRERDAARADAAAARARHAVESERLRVV